jgi:hypothetical protein
MSSQKRKGGVAYRKATSVRQIRGNFRGMSVLITLRFAVENALLAVGEGQQQRIIVQRLHA